MKNAHGKLGVAFAALLTGGLTAPAMAAGVDAGTLIENTAEATYDIGGSPTTITSNTVGVSVDELLDVTLTSLDGGPISTTAGTEVLTFELTNTGNGPEAFRLTADPSVAGNDFDTTIDAIAVDTNSNGVYDAGVDTILTGPETTDVLAEDEAITVFVIVTVPGTATDGDQSDVQLLAEAVTGTGSPGDVFAGQGVLGVNAIVGSSGASATSSGSLTVALTSVSLVKSQAVADPFGGTATVPGSVITYTIVASVSGSGTVNNLVVTDPFPTGTTYSTGTLALDGSSLTDASGDDAGTVSGTGISVDLGSVSAGTSQSITFDVVVD